MHHGLLFFLPLYRKNKVKTSFFEGSFVVCRVDITCSTSQTSASFLFTGLSLGLDFAHAISLNFHGRLNYYSIVRRVRC